MFRQHIAIRLKFEQIESSGFTSSHFYKALYASNCPRLYKSPNDSSQLLLRNYGNFSTSKINYQFTISKKVKDNFGYVKNASPLYSLHSLL